MDETTFHELLGRGAKYNASDALFKVGQPPAVELVRKEIGNDWTDSALKAVADAEKQLRSY